MNLSLIGFRYVRVVISMLIVMMVAGVYSYFTMPANEDPSITIRQALIVTRNEGLPADKVETLVTKPLELAVRKRPEVKKIKSTSMSGQSILIVEIYDKYFELDQIWDDVRDEVEQVSLPSGTTKPNLNDSFGDVSVVTAALVAEDGLTNSEKTALAQDIRDQLYGVTNTQKVSILGIQPEKIYIEVENAKIAELGYSPNVLAGLIAQQNTIKSGGEIDINGSTLVLQPTGQFQSVEDIRNLLLPLPNGQGMVTLDDIADVRRDVFDPAIQPVFFNGKSAIMFAINMDPKANILEYTPRVEDKINQINQGLPAGAKIEIATKQAVQVEKSLYGVTLNVLQTLVIVLVVVMLFLGMRTGLIVGSVVPAVMLVSITIINVLGMSLERMSLATLIIALGLLVENGIVIAEDFRQRLERGESRDDALKEGGKSLAMPLLTSSATTILVFLPLLMANHVAGEYTRSISIVIAVVLLTSWVLAMLVTPTMCYYFMKVKPKDPNEALNKSNDKKKGFSFFEPFQWFYDKTLRVMLRIRPIYLLGVVLVFALSIMQFKTVPKKFFPDSDRTQVLVYLTQPAETSMRETEKMLKQSFEGFSNKEQFPHVESYAGYGGFGGPRFVLSLTPVNPADNKAFVVLNVDDPAHMDETIEKTRDMFRTKFPNVEAKVMRMFLGPSDSNVMQVRVYGPDDKVLYETAKKVEAILQSKPNVMEVNNDWQNRVTELQVNVDQQRAKQLGISSSDIAQSLQMYYSGTAVSLYRDGDEKLPIVLQGKQSERDDMSRLYSTQVYSSTTKSAVPLSQIAQVIPVNTYSYIMRENLSRSIIIEGRNSKKSAEEFKADIDDEIQALAATLPANHFIEYDGPIKQSLAAQAALSANFPLCMGIIIILLIAQFNSFRRALMVLLAIPLMMVGATLGLKILQADFGFMVTLGLYSLAGIIVNNAIVLIDRIDMERQQAKEKLGAMVDDFEIVIAASVKRLRPIMMTTITTMLGLLPLLISRDPLFYGMAGVIAFGLGVGAFLTLTFTPVVYSLFFNIKPKKEGDNNRYPKTNNKAAANA